MSLYITDKVLSLNDINPTEKLVLAQLIYWANNPTEKNIKGVATTTYPKLARVLNLTNRQIEKSIKVLSEKEYINVYKIYSGKRVIKTDYMIKEDLM